MRQTNGREKMRISKNPEARRQEIIEIATGLFTARGISKTSISDVAEAVGVAKGLVYYYFASKEDLVQCIVKQLATGVDQALQAIQIGRASCRERV